jgi:hypothetical protein
MHEDLDFRVYVSVFDHPKFLRLEAALSERACMALFRLWGWARRHRKDGDLTGLSDREIAIAARWKGAAARFVTALREIGWLDGDAGAFKLHGWRKAQPHSMGALSFERAQQVRALERWAKKAGAPSVEAYVQTRHGMTLEEYLESEPSADCDAAADAGHMPGMMPGSAEADASSPPSPSHPPPPQPPPAAAAADPLLGILRAGLRWRGSNAPLTQALADLRAAGVPDAGIADAARRADAVGVKPLTFRDRMLDRRRGEAAAPPIPPGWDACARCAATGRVDAPASPLGSMPCPRCDGRRGVPREPAAVHERGYAAAGGVHGAPAGPAPAALRRLAGGIPGAS